MTDGESERKPWNAIAGPGICMTQQQIADAMGISKAMVHFLEHQAIDKIRRQLINTGFDPDSDY